jgi:hypothetical protein
MTGIEPTMFGSRVALTTRTHRPSLVESNPLAIGQWSL